MSEKKNNARIEKWRVMLSNGLHKDPDSLQSRTRKGIPPQIRMIAWPELVKLRKHIQQRTPQFTYQKLVNSLSNNVYEISLDIPRTFPEEEDIKVLQRSMNNVLKAIAIVHPKIGYCQGMNFLVARLLGVLGDEEVFWLMDFLLMRDSNLRNNFTNPKHITLNNSIFEQLLSETHPQILPILSEKCIITQSYTIKCFMTLFSSVLRQELFFRIFEVYLLEGWSIIYAVAIFLFSRYEKDYVKGAMEDIHVILNKKIYDIGNADIDWVMEQALKIGITEEKIQSISLGIEKQTNKSKVRGSLTSQVEVENREKANKKMVKFVPQQENCSALTFQNKSEQVNFDALYILNIKNQNQ